ncbi:MAG: DUF4339 domain-containing protein [Planctomycetota bacterium]|nr:DUF4339 domain-containing protein [Planctomycetaceae bacterium]MDQ3329322.1 DUF4339 domain-containing protein [Planctomycetota bacterium]
MTNPPSPSPATTPASHWWLSEQGQERGPYGKAFILAGLKTGTLSPETLAWPEGGTIQRPLREWRAFTGGDAGNRSSVARAAKAVSVPSTSGPRRFPAFLLAILAILLAPTAAAIREVVFLLTGWNLAGLTSLVSLLSILGALALLIYGLVDRRLRPDLPADYNGSCSAAG